MISPMSYVKNTRKSYRKDLGRVITEVQVQFLEEDPTWIPYDTLLSISNKFTT